MRTIPLILMLALGSAQADEKDSLWALILSIKNDPKAADTLIWNAGLSKEGAENFVAFATESLKNLEAEGKKRQQDMCSDRAKLKASRKDFADALKKIEDAEQGESDGLLANIDVILAVEDASKLKAWATETFTPEVVPGSAERLSSYVRAGHGNYVAGVDSICGQVEGQITICPSNEAIADSCGAHVVRHAGPRCDYI